MNIPHLDLQIEYLTAIKAGKRMEWRWKERNDRWNGWYKAPTPSWKKNLEYEIREVKPQQYIPEADVPRAMTAAPEEGSSYWSFDVHFKEPVTEFVWEGLPCDYVCLRNGLCFAIEADARAAWEAMTARRERS